MSLPANVRAADVAPTRRRAALLIAALVLVAVGVRLPGIVSEPIDFHATRQLRGLVVARGFEYRLRPPSDSAVEHAAIKAADDLGWLEPPLLEAVTATAWAVFGEQVWMPRLLVTLGYLSGAVALWFLADRLIGRVGAWVAFAFYTFTSYSLVSATSVQPDPLQVGALCVALLAAVRWQDDPNPHRRRVLLIAAALATLLKPSTAPMVLGALAALTIQRLGLRRALTDRATWILLGSAVAPSAIFLLIGTATGAIPSGNVSAYFIPSLLLDAWFWHDWLAQLSAVVGLPALAIALYGLVRTRPTARALGIALVCGYVVYGIGFDYRVATHSYYTLPLVPVVALGLGAAAAVLAEAWPSRLRVFSAAGAVLLALGVVPFWNDETAFRNGSPAIVRSFTAVGEAVEHRPVIDLSGDGGYALAFYAQVRVAPWPSSADLELEQLRNVRAIGVADRLAALRSSVDAEYFVVNASIELERQPELRAMLDRLPVVLRTPGAVVYRLSSSP